MSAAEMPPIGSHVHVLRDDVSEGVFHAAIVVGHFTDPELGNVLEVRMSDSKRVQRTWPSSTIRPAA